MPGCPRGERRDRPGGPLWTIWDFNQPAESEQRFRTALADLEASAADSSAADSEEALLARTQLARTLGLQSRFDECATELDAVAGRVGGGSAGATPLVRAYERLERGRMHRYLGRPRGGRPHVPGRPGRSRDGRTRPRGRRRRAHDGDRG